MIDLANSVNNVSPKTCSQAELDTCVENLSKHFITLAREHLELRDRETSKKNRVK